ncbi:MAG: TonB-dependent receptor [Bradymonadia bacterium]
MSWAEEDQIKVYGRDRPDEIDRSRSTASTTRRQLDERQVQSTPDALKYTPGVYVQQTGHGQGSPYIRGRTGQQTLFLYDGLRINHALFRQGPNQYLFTVDPNTIGHISVVRGSASVDLGNDAIAGAILLKPLEPQLDPNRQALWYQTTMTMTHSTADQLLGGRLQIDAQFNSKFAIVAGVGARKVGRLEAGGHAFPNGRADGQACESSTSVPCFEPDGRTQLGTGFDELTADARAVYDDGRTRFIAAAYIYRQFDAPRTDQCPAPEAAVGECLVIDEQFRTHTYVKVDHKSENQFSKNISAAFGYQRQHQRYTLVRPDRNPTDGFDTTNINGGRDAIDGIGAFTRLESAPLSFENGLKLQVRYGLDGNHEWVDSAKWIQFVEPPTTRILSRGQYIAGSKYTQGGLFASPTLHWGPLLIRVGARGAAVRAQSPGDAETGSRPFDKVFTQLIKNAGLRLGQRLALVVNVEEGFRVPNLDDLVARQSTGQGYQLDNPNLRPERALTLEGGLEVAYKTTRLEFLVYQQRLTDAIERRLLTLADCTLDGGFVDQACRANRAPLQLVNLTGDAVIYGAETRLQTMLATRLKLRATLSYAYGEGDHPNGDSERTPLSRIPPLNGSGELTKRWTNGLYAGYSIRWATKQDRLSIADVADARIPMGGTPGYVVHDLRMGLRVRSRLQLNVVLQNLTDERYRTHGSGIYSAGRAISGTLKITI